MNIQRLLVPYLGVILALGLSSPAFAQIVNSVNTVPSVTGVAPAIAASGSDTNIDIALTPKGTGNITSAAGNFVGAAKTDIVQFYPAVSLCKSDNALLIPTRVAAADWALARTAAGAETYNISCPLTPPTRTTAGKGWKLTAFSVAHQITVVNNTSSTFNSLSTDRKSVV